MEICKISTSIKRSSILKLMSRDTNSFSTFDSIDQHGVCARVHLVQAVISLGVGVCRLIAGSALTC